MAFYSRTHLVLPETIHHSGAVTALEGLGARADDVHQLLPEGRWPTSALKCFCFFVSVFFFRAEEGEELGLDIEVDGGSGFGLCQAEERLQLFNYFLRKKRYNGVLFVPLFIDTRLFHF